MKTKIKNLPILKMETIMTVMIKKNKTKTNYQMAKNKMMISRKLKIKLMTLFKKSRKSLRNNQKGITMIRTKIMI